jgi:hypothetical protein
MGDIQSAIVAAFIGPGQAVVAGGLLCLAGVGAVGRWLPELKRHVIGRAASLDVAADAPATPHEA